MSNIHPFEGERMGHGDTLRFWDDYADVYSSMQQGDIPQRIVCMLSDEGYWNWVPGLEHIPSWSHPVSGS